MKCGAADAVIFGQQTVVALVPSTRCYFDAWPSMRRAGSDLLGTTTRSTAKVKRENTEKHNTKQSTKVKRRL